MYLLKEEDRPMQFVIDKYNFLIENFKLDGIKIDLY